MKKSTDLNVIGVYPQAKGVPAGYTHNFYKRERSMTKLTSAEFPDFEPELIWELEEEALLTDIVSPSNMLASGWLVNEKVRDILAGLELSTHRVYPATVIYQSIPLKYYWFHFVNPNLEEIDFKKSKFALTNLLRTRIEKELDIASFDEYLKEKEKMDTDQLITCTDVKLKEKYQDRDLIYLFTIAKFFLCSERVKYFFNRSHVSGVSIEII